MTTIKIEPLTKQAFEPFGDVIEIRDDANSYPINGATTARYHDLATVVATGEEARTIISMARATPFQLPLEISMVERHPLGSQAFIPVRPTRFVVTVAPDEHGRPGTPRAFMAEPGQGINYFLGTWHAVLTAIDGETDFIIVDRAGEGDNLEEYHYPEPFTVSP